MSDHRFLRARWLGWLYLAEAGIPAVVWLLVGLLTDGPLASLALPGAVGAVAGIAIAARLRRASWRYVATCIPAICSLLAAVPCADPSARGLLEGAIVIGSMLPAVRVLVDAKLPKLRVVICGPQDACAVAAEALRRPAIETTLTWSEREPREEELASLEETVERTMPDYVVVCGELDAAGPVLQRLHRIPVWVGFMPGFQGLDVCCPSALDRDGLPAVRLVGAGIDEVGLIAKWLLDKFIALSVLVIAGPTLLLIAAAIKIWGGPGPVLFVQERHGLGGRVIRMWKFRTMRHDTENPDNGDGTGSFCRQAVVDDPRVTRIGRFLRNSSLDELPQFFNVLAGDMSVVGPRPHPLNLNRKYIDEVPDLMRRHLLRPGITGLAQVGGARGETRTADDMRRRIGLDIAYLRDPTVLGDLRIIALTALKGLCNSHP